MNTSVDVKFWLRVDKVSGPVHPFYSRCWVWTGAKDRDGYGKFSISKFISKRSHVYSYELFTESTIPTGLLVCHKCDNTSCVRPSHLFLGTHADNHKDRNYKNRQAKGTKNGRAVITEQIVRLIRSEYLKGSKFRNIKYLSVKYGISWGQVQRIVTRRQWRHVV